MERFTQRAENGNVIYPHCFEECQGMAETEKCINCEYYDRLLNKFAEYEELEEQGMMLRLPYPVGTELYFAFRLQGVKKDHIRRWQYNKKGLMFYSHGSAYTVDSIGRTVFLTEEEAENALKQMGE